LRSKTEMLAELRTMLHDVFAARERGTSHPRMARAHGYVDGYMRGMLETGVATKQELLALVAEQRAAVCGPATTEMRAPMPSYA
jgi:hypothetical protein